MGASLCLLEVHRDGTATHRTLFESPKGVIRDPDVSYDGRRILFAWKKSIDRGRLPPLRDGRRDRRRSPVHLRPRASPTTKGAYLPGGDIVFNSTRCVQTVDCWWTEV